MDEQSSNQSHWIPLADLMTGLMMVFMLLTAAFMLRVEQTTTLVVREYVDTKDEMLRALQREFAKDLQQWNATILGDMTIRFNDPTALFATGSATLQPRFRQQLADFFPRYIDLLYSDKFRATITEIRIEGHTSAFWAGAPDARNAYFQNMRLSQERTRSTLEFLFSLPKVQGREPWLVERLTANGLSSSRPVTDGGQALAGSAALNQRVEFRIVTNADERIGRIVKSIGANGT
ncbi:MAG: flagellar motor protein MotB [Lautropia sp.]